MDIDILFMLTYFSSSLFADVVMLRSVGVQPLLPVWPSVPLLRQAGVSCTKNDGKYAFC